MLLKFFVHVSEKQLKANVQKAEKTYGKGWNKVSESDDDFVDYQRYLEIYEKMFIDSDRHSPLVSDSPATIRVLPRSRYLM